MPSGFSQRLTKVVRCSVAGPLWGRRVAMRRASERSVLSEKFQRVGSWDAMTISRTKSRSISARVCSHDGPVHTVSGSTRANRPSPGRSFGAAVATKAAPSPAVADACLDFRRRESSFCSLRRSDAGRLPNSRLPPTERVNGGFMMARSRSGSVAVTPCRAPREPLPYTLSVSLIRPAAVPIDSGDSANCTAASPLPRKSSEPRETFDPSAPSAMT